MTSYLGTRAADAAVPGPSAPPPWTVLRRAGRPDVTGRVPSLRRVLVQVVAAAVVVLVGVALVGALVSRRSAERESVHQVAELTNVLADSVVQPALTDAMARSSTAAAALDPLVRTWVLSGDLVRVKIWTPAGRILYSDEPRLVGRSFELDRSARRALAHPQVRADITDLDEPENRYERGQGTLLEVHRPVWTPDGSPLLFETYFRYAPVSARAGALWRGFAGITLSSMLAMVILLVPLAWTLVRRARRAQQHRELGLRRAVEASHDERRRIAASLHDGVVQELVAASLAVSGGAQQAAGRGEDELAERLRDAGGAVRLSIAGMRSLLVEIYPPSLHSEGLERALGDLAAGLHSDVALEIDDRATRRLGEAQTEAVFRVAQEGLRNAVAHAGAGVIVLRLRPGRDSVELQIEDDGCGFDPSVRPDGHFGRTLVKDAAGSVGAELALRTAPGAGTCWRMRVPA